MHHHDYPVRIAIVGAGQVGSTLAYRLVFSGLAGEIVLIDANKMKAEGEALDLAHSLSSSIHPTRVWAGDYEDCAAAAVIVLACGAPIEKGETQFDFVKRNTDIFCQVIPQITRYKRDGILLIASHPVDILTYTAYKISGWPGPRVLGSGTVLDTARLRELLSAHYQIGQQNIHAYLIGEHGDREVPVWSLANITGMQLKDFCFTNGMYHDQRTLDDIFRKTRTATHHIIECKGTAYYATARALMCILEAILKDQKAVLCVSSLIENYYGINNICLSMPAVVGAAGVEKFLRLDLNQQELEGLKYSAELLKTELAKLALEAK